MKTKKEMRIKRKVTIRRKVWGTRTRPRLSVFRSNTSFEVQVIDDEHAKTILSAHRKGKKIESASALGQAIAQHMKEKKITTVVFDRSGYRYHGAVKALADAIRQGGIRV